MSKNIAFICSCSFSLLLCEMCTLFECSLKLSLNQRVPNLVSESTRLVNVYMTSASEPSLIFERNSKTTTTQEFNWRASNRKSID